MKELGRIDKVDLGINPSLPHSRCPLWVDGNGVIFQEDCVQPEPGQVRLFDKVQSFPIAGMLEARLDPTTASPPFLNEKNHLFFSTKTSNYMWGEGDAAPTVISGATTGWRDDANLSRPATRCTWVQWGNWAIVTMGKDVLLPLRVVKLPSTTPVTINPSPNFTTCEIFVVFRNQLIAFNTNEGTDTIFFSDSDDFETAAAWTPTQGNNAGMLVARDIEGPILAALPMGDGVAFYGSGSMHMLSFIGAPLVFGERQIQRNIGAVGKFAVCSVGRLHYGFGPRGIWRTDGFKYDYIDQPWIHDFIFKDLNRDQWSKVLAANNVTEEMVEFHYPTADSLEPNRTVGWNYRKNLWTIKNFARTAYSPADNFLRPIFGSADGDVFMQSTEVAGSSTSGLPLTLVATYSAPGFYGEMGYGTGGYGGHGGDG